MEITKRYLKMRKYFFPVVIIVFSIISGIVVHSKSSFIYDNHFTLLAESFIKNDLFLNPVNLPKGDFADWKGHQFIYYGPTPALLLIPFVLFFGLDFPQYLISVISLILVFLGVFILTRKLNFKNYDSLWLSIFFVFGTVLYFGGLVNISAYLVQTLGTVFVIFSLVEYFTKRRWWLIGVFVALAGFTRINLFGMMFFYALEIFRTNQVDRRRLCVIFMLPILVSTIVLGIYNFRRFGSVLESGYDKHALELNDTGNNNKIGYFNIEHAPTKLYLMLFSAPEPVKRDSLEYVLKFPYLKANGYGMAIWFTSPLFLYLLFAKKKPYSNSALVAIAALMLPSFMFSGTGASQFGYRYSLDFIPLLFLILLSAFEKGLPKFAKLLITAGVIFNCSYMSSIWNSYPLFFWMK